MTFGVTTGRSSDNLDSINNHFSSFPFFNIQTGDKGTLGAIGWTGSWLKHTNRAADGKTIALDAGMLKTHLLLHPGETIRTPRILLMDWHGDILDTQNTWRKLMLAYYSPKDLKGNVVAVPACWGSWGTERVAPKLTTIQHLTTKKFQPMSIGLMPVGMNRSPCPLACPPMPGHLGRNIAVTGS